MYSMEENYSSLDIIRFSVEFIADEARKIPTSPSIKGRVLGICDDIQESLDEQEEKGKAYVIKGIQKHLYRFGAIIEETSNVKEERKMNFLLTSNVGDMFYALAEEE